MNALKGIHLHSYEKFHIKGSGIAFSINTDDYIGPNFHKGTKVHAEGKIWVVTSVDMLRRGNDVCKQISLNVKEVE